MQVVNHREAYGLFACSGILSNHESSRRPPHFVIRKIVKAAVAISQGSHERLTLGNVDIVRDWGWAPEFVEAMWRILQQDQPRDYVIATGESHSLGAVAERIFRATGLDWRDHVDLDASLLRPTDLLATHVSPRRARAELGWIAHTRIAALVDQLVTEERAIICRSRAAPA
jgi:GDPmannose 4,6-dehydratase